MSKKGLGRGLGAIFGEETAAVLNRKDRKKENSTAAQKAAAEKQGDSSADPEAKSEADSTAETVKQPKNRRLRKNNGAVKDTDAGSEASANKSSAAAAGAASDTASDSASDVSRETLMLRISMIEPNASQPRKNFNEESLAELAESIREHGVLQPILVKKKGQMYEIIVGERRWRASRMAGLTEIPAIVRELDSREAAEVALIENIQREDLGCIEEARAYKALIEEFGLTQEQLAQRISRNRTTITNSMRLLQLGDDVLELVENGELSAGHARTILGITGKRNQYKAAREIINNGLSVRQTEKLVKSYNNAAAGAGKKKEKSEEALTRELYISAAEKELTEIMNTKVSIRQTGKTKGKIEIEYYSDDELNELIERFH